MFPPKCVIFYAETLKVGNSEFDANTRLGEGGCSIVNEVDAIELETKHSDPTLQNDDDNDNLTNSKFLQKIVKVHSWIFFCRFN